MTNIEPIAVPIDQGAALIGCKRSKLYELIKAGEIPLVKIGGKSVVPVAALRGFIAAKTNTTLIAA